MIAAIGRVGDGSEAGAFCRWAARLGERSRLISLEAPEGGAPQLESVDHRLAEQGRLGEDWLADVGLLHLPGSTLKSEGYATLARLAVEQMSAQGGLIAVDATGLGTGSGWQAALEAMRPGILFLDEDQASALGGRLARLTEIPVLKLPGGGSRIYGRRLPSVAWEVRISPDADQAFLAAFCTAFLEGAPPIEAGARAAILWAQVAGGATTVAGTR